MKPADIFIEAQRRRKKITRWYCAEEYIDTIVLLRDQKNMTWREISNFFDGFGVEFGEQTLSRVYKKNHQKKAQALSVIGAATHELAQLG